MFSWWKADACKVLPNWLVRQKFAQMPSPIWHTLLDVIHEGVQSVSNDKHIVVPCAVDIGPGKMVSICRQLHAICLAYSQGQ